MQLSDGSVPQYFCPILQNVREIGRTSYDAQTQTRWLALSGAGISFQFTGRKCAVTLCGDSAVRYGEDIAARYAVYVNGIQTMDAQLLVPLQTICVWESDSVQTIVVRIIKLSEAAFSCMGIREIAVWDADGIKPTETASHLIEFIGDSITCGYGVDEECPTARFQTRTENVLHSYAYQTAEALHADYSMVAYSGYGILSGFSADGSQNKRELLPPWYETVGYSKTVLEHGRKMQESRWDFAVRPDLIVVNLGTNDASYTKEDAQKQAAFSAAYLAFLRQVTAHNPNVPILCILGVMGDVLWDAVCHAVDAFRIEFGADAIAVLHLENQSAADGFAVDWHPSAATHRKTAEKLTGTIRKWMHW